MASRPALEAWLTTAAARVDEPVVVGRRLGVLPQERSRDIEIRYGSILGDDYLQLVNIDPTAGLRSDSLLVRGRALRDLRRHLEHLDAFLGGSPR